LYSPFVFRVYDRIVFWLDVPLYCDLLLQASLYRIELMADVSSARYINLDCRRISKFFV
jgi:hypothetical protein